MHANAALLKMKALESGRPAGRKKSDVVLKFQAAVTAIAAWLATGPRSAAELRLLGALVHFV